MKLKNIAQGWLNYMKNEKLTEKEQHRVYVCASCPHKRFSKSVELFVNDEFKEIEGYYCNICLCPLSTKIRSKDEKCPIWKWD